MHSSPTKSLGYKAFPHSFSRLTIYPMDLGLASKDASWWLFTLPAFLGTTNLFDAFVILSFFITFATIGLLTWAFAVGGIAWKNDRNHKGTVAIPGPRGLPIFGSIFKMSRGLAHRTLAAMATSRSATQLMAFSLGSTPVVVASDPHTAREILTSPYFADRPIKESAMKLMFDRAMGFAPNGTYWRFLRRIASSQLFAFKRIAAYEPGRQLDCSTMLNAIANEQSLEGKVGLRKHLQAAALNNIMGSVFGKRYDVTHDTEELKELHEMVREGFELLGAFNLSDYLPWLSYFYDPYRIKERCAVLVPKVKKFVGRIIEEHQQNGGPTNLSDDADFVDVMLSLEGEEKMEKDDMIAVLWVRLVNHNIPTLEWVMAELVLNQDIQGKLQKELDDVVGSRKITDADIVKLPYLQAVVKETLRVHPPGPLLSWARLSTSDVHLSNGMIIPSNTTAMVNMWHITHDPKVWKEPLVFKPERFVESDGGANVDVRGSDLRLAPFGAGRRVCPGKNLGLATVNLWVAKLVQNFKWVADQEHSVDFSEVLKLSCEMKHPLIAQATPRNIVASF